MLFVLPKKEKAGQKRHVPSGQHMRRKVKLLSWVGVLRHFCNHF